MRCRKDCEVSVVSPNIDTVPFIFVKRILADCKSVLSSFS